MGWSWAGVDAATFARSCGLIGTTSTAKGKLLQKAMRAWLAYPRAANLPSNLVTIQASGGVKNAVKTDWAMPTHPGHPIEIP